MTKIDISALQEVETFAHRADALMILGRDVTAKINQLRDLERKLAEQQEGLAKAVQQHEAQVRTTMAWEQNLQRRQAGLEALESRLKAERSGEVLDDANGKYGHDEKAG